MRILNRVIVVLFCLAVLAGAVLFLVAPAALLSTVQNAAAGLSASLGVRSTAIIAAVVSAVLLLLALLVLVLEFRPQRRKTVRIRSQGRGNAALRVDSVAQTLEYRLDEIEGVRKVVPHLDSRGSDLKVLLEVDAAPDASIPMLSDRIIDRTLRILEGELGLQVRGRVRLDITHEPYPTPTAVPRPAVAQPAVQEGVSQAPVQAAPATAARPEPVFPEPVVRPEPAAPQVHVPTPAPEPPLIFEEPKRDPAAAETPGEEVMPPSSKPWEAVGGVGVYGADDAPQRVTIVDEGEQEEEDEDEDEGNAPHSSEAGTP